MPHGDDHGRTPGRQDPACERDSHQSSEGENPAPATPLSYTGTAEELDAELGKHLASDVECPQQLGSTLAQAKAEMEAAAKAAQEEAKKKAAERTKKATEKPVEKVATPTPAPPPEAGPATMSLFAAPAPEAASTTPTPGCRMPR